MSVSKKNIIVLQLTALYILSPVLARGQSAYPFSGSYSQTPGPVEKIVLFTDRSIYCTNERVYFTACYSCPGKPDSLNWSKVLYVELITWNGDKIVQLKLRLNLQGAYGSFKIPDNVLSGNYYLRAYTRWMRNYSANLYGYNLLKIVNPFNPDINAGQVETQSEIRFRQDTMQRDRKIDGVSCFSVTKNYKTREKVEIRLVSDSNLPLSCCHYCVSVVKEGMTNAEFYSFAGSTAKTKKPQEIEYLPDIRGISVTGKIIDKATRLPLKNVIMFASEPAKGQYLSTYLTDDAGRFIFTLPYMKGEYDLYTGAGLPDTVKTEIYIDNDFCDKPITLPYIPFQLNNNEKKLVKEMMINVQLNEKFLNDEIRAYDTTNNYCVFYGHSTSVVYPDKYIELPTLEEFFAELVPDVYLRHKKGTAYLQNEGMTGLSDSRPLVLLDNIPVNDMESLLKIPSGMIDRIEVINRGYIVAGMKYNGLISIYSKNNDYAGLDVNRNSIFFTYKLYADDSRDVPFVKPDSIYPGKPIRRNLLYWNPDIVVSASKETVISFTTPDNPGDYIVIVQGYTSRSESILYGTCSFSVR